MTSLLKPVFVLFFAFALAAPAFAAEPLTGDKIGRFLDSLEELDSRTADFPKITQTLDGIDVENSFGELLNAEGELSIFSWISGQAVQYPDENAKLGKIATDHGFSSLVIWSSTGDRIVRTFMANEIPADQRAMVMAVDDAMLQQIPEPQREQVMMAKKMVSSLSNVSDADIVTLEPHLDRLRTALDF